ncbi:GNS1/SUR4 membrane protein family [Euphorbia peplus]|nr:GNS1/SUR4 membrane protein family [Euphorbia peplus]
MAEMVYQTIRHLVLNHLIKLPGFNLLPYWVVSHPKIHNFEWKQGQTPASSLLFLTLTVTSYLSITLFISRAASRSSFTTNPRVLRMVSAFHNLFLLSLSLLMAAGSGLSIVTLLPTWDTAACFPMNTQPKGPLFFWAYVFYLSKILEFMDTVLIILGNNSKRRLSFLHLYHHSTVVVMCYISLNTSQSMFPGVLMINSLVHVIMYFYYFLCTVGLRPRWKKFVTDCQIWQFFSSFATMACIFYYHFTGNGCSGILGWCFDAVYIASLLVMFLDFHSKNYSKEDLKPKSNKIH